MKLQKMNKVKRDPKKFETFELFATLIEELGYNLSDEDIVQKISKEFQDAIKESSNRKTMIYGKRNEGLFSYVVRGLNEIKLIKQEDSGDTYTTLNEEVKTPDFRIILENNKLIFVEVKNFNKHPFENNYVFDKSYIDSLKRYSKLNNGELYISINYVMLKRIVLVSIDRFKLEFNKYVLKIEDAFKYNEIYLLGDYKIALPTPLEMHIKVDCQNVEELSDSKIYDVTTREVAFKCRGVEVQDEIGKLIALRLICFGEWKESEKFVLDDSGVLKEIHYSFFPEGYDEHEMKDGDLQIITEMSVLLVKSFEHKTTSNNLLKQLTYSGLPLDLNTIIPHDYTSEELPIYRLSLRPSN